MSTMLVSQLLPGQPFRVTLAPGDYLDYKLIHCNDCRAHVEPLGRVRKTIMRKEEFDDLLGGAPLAEFDTHGGRVNIAPGTVCTLLNAPDDLDDLFGLGVTVTITKQLRPALVPSSLRALDPKTKRGQVVAMLAAGKKVPAVCAALGIKRSCALSHMSDARKFNGVQYETDGDVVKVALPAAAKSDGLEDLL